MSCRNVFIVSTSKYVAITETFNSFMFYYITMHLYICQANICTMLYVHLRHN